jgi:Aerotolerance regulator N-terminal/von Willebrand factor type A domain
MFSFLNSAILAAAATALIPLLIHLFSKRKMKVVVFSSLRYLHGMQKRQVRRIKIRQILLLALRTMILLLAVMAFARPVTKSGYLGSHAGVSAVIVLDVSASMSQQTNNGPLFDAARRQALEISKNFGESDEVALLAFGGAENNNVGFGSAARIREALKEIEVSDGSGSLSSATTQALELFKSAGNFNRELYLITDLQANSLPDTTLQLIEGIDNSKGAFRIYLTDPAALRASSNGEHDNVGITGVDFGGQLIEVGSEFTVGFSLQNYSPDSKKNLIASLFIEEQRVAQTDFSLSPHEQKRLTFNHRLSRAGRTSARIEISNDDYAGDNAYYFAFYVPELFNLLIVNNNAGGEFLRLALEPTKSGVRHWIVKQVNRANLAGLALDAYDAVALLGIDQLNRSESASVSRFVRKGGGVLFFPGPSLTAETFQSGLAEFTGLQMTEDIVFNPPSSGYYTLEELDYSHPALQPFAEIHKDGLPGYKFFSIPKFTTGSDVTTLARFSGGHPALAERQLGRGRIIVFAGMLRPDMSNFMTHSFFVPFAIRLAEYAASDLSNYDYRRFVGEAASIPLPKRASPNDVLTLLTPERQRIRIQPVARDGAYKVHMPPFKQAGIYNLRSSLRVVERFAVNVNPQEGNLQTVSSVQAQRILGVELETLPVRTEVAGFLEQKRTGKELWKVLLWLAVLALVIETVLSGDWFGRRADTKS